MEMFFAISMYIYYELSEYPYYWEKMAESIILPWISLNNAQIHNSHFGKIHNSFTCAIFLFIWGHWAKIEKHRVDP